MGDEGARGGNVTVRAAAAGALSLAVLAAACGTPSAVEERLALPSCGRYERLNKPPTADQGEKNRVCSKVPARARA